MQQTDPIYEELYLSRDYYMQTSVVVCDNNIPLANDTDEVIENGFGEEELINVSTTRNVFANNVPEVGSCTCGEIDVEIIYPINVIPKMARITPYIRLVKNDKSKHSNWYRKGVFFVDSRDVTKNNDGLRILTLHGYDAMLKTENTYPWSEEASPIDIDAVNTIAQAIGVEVDARTTAIINKGYEVLAPIGYTMRETLGHIAGAYGGNFIINDLGKLQLICLWNLPTETNYLTDEVYNPITFGGDRMVLQED